jgi:hypothetical protein
MQHRAWGTGVACFAIAGAVLHAADTNGQEHRLELEWSAPPACPTRADVLQTIDSLLGRPANDVLEAPLGVRARVDAIERIWTVELWWRASGVEQTRRLQATSCAELARAAALVVAFAIDPGGEALGTTETPALPAQGEAGPPVAERPAADREPAPVPTLPVPAGRASLPPPAPADRKPPDRRERRSEGELLWFARAQAAFDFGALPSPAVGAAAGAGIRRGPFLGAAELSLFYPQEVNGTSAGTQGGGRFWLGGASLEPCYVMDLRDAAVHFCAVARLDLIAAAGQGVVTTEDGVAWFARVGAGAQVWHPLTSNLGLLAGVRGLVGPAVPTFVIDDGVVHEPDFFSVLGTAGVEFGPF